MIVHEIYGIDSDGMDIVKTYSDAGVKIEFEGRLYTEAYDPADDVKDYTETEIPVEPVEEEYYETNNDSNA